MFALLHGGDLPGFFLFLAVAVLVGGPIVFGLWYQSKTGKKGGTDRSSNKKDR
jgi:hypothetical protein